MMACKKNVYGRYAGLFLLAGCLLAGCASTQKKIEKEEAYRKIGINAMEAKNYTAAIEAFDNALGQAGAVGANEVDICYYKAAAQYAAGSLSDAIATYDTMLEYDNKDAEAYFLRGCIFLNMKESDKAQEDFSNAVKYAYDLEIYRAIYNSLNGAGYESEGRAYLEQALEEKPGRKAKNYTVRGRIYFLEGNHKESVENLVKAVEKGDTNANLYLAQAYEALGDPVQAEACINAYIEVYPKSSVSYNQLGRRALEDGDYGEAIERFEEGLSLEEVTNEQELRSNLIAAYEYSGEFERAEELMLEYIKDYPGDEAAAREYRFLARNKNEETGTE